MNYIEILEELKEDLKMELDSEHLKNNKISRLQPIVDKIIKKKKLQIEAIDYVINNIRRCNYGI